MSMCTRSLGCISCGISAKILQNKVLFSGQLTNFLTRHLASQSRQGLRWKSALNSEAGNLQFVAKSHLRHLPLIGATPGIRSYATGGQPVFEADTPYPLSRYSNMSAKHLSKGSTCPPLEDGKLRIYSMRFCPYAQRALLVAEAKNVPHDVVNCNLMQKPEWIFKLNPMGKVPTFELPQGALYESLVVCDYLDEVYPERPLHPKDAFRKAEDRIIVENFNKVISAYYKVLFNKSGDTEEVSALLKKTEEEMAPFEQLLETRGTKFFGGAELPGMVDYMIWPWIERMPVMKMVFPDVYDYGNFKKTFPRLESWRQAMKEDGAVKKIFLSPDIHFQFTMSYRNGAPDYDILEKEVSSVTTFASASRL